MLLQTALLGCDLLVIFFYEICASGLLAFLLFVASHHFNVRIFAARAYVFHGPSPHLHLLSRAFNALLYSPVAPD